MESTTTNIVCLCVSWLEHTTLRDGLICEVLLQRGIVLHASACAKPKLATFMGVKGLSYIVVSVKVKSQRSQGKPMAFQHRCNNHIDLSDWLQRHSRLEHCVAC